MFISMSALIYRLIYFELKNTNLSLHLKPNTNFNTEIIVGIFNIFNIF